jgi:hypothetical protein
MYPDSSSANKSGLLFFISESQMIVLQGALKLMETIVYILGVLFGVYFGVLMEYSIQ